MTFDEWLYNKLLNGDLQLDEILDQIDDAIIAEDDNKFVDTDVLVKWLQAAYQVGYEAGIEDGRDEFG